MKTEKEIREELEIKGREFDFLTNKCREKTGLEKLGFLAQKNEVEIEYQTLKWVLGDL